MRTGKNPRFVRSRVEVCNRPENAFIFESISDYLTMIYTIKRAITRQISKSCGITPLQYCILLQLLLTPKVPLKQLAECLEARVSTTSIAVSKLVKLGLVSRSENAEDMRVVKVALSSEGLSALRSIHNSFHDSISEYLGLLTERQFNAIVSGSVSTVATRHESSGPVNAVRPEVAVVLTVLMTERMVEHALHPMNLTVKDYRILLTLKLADAPVSNSDIAGFLFLNPGDITACLKHLGSMGFIRSGRSEVNRRARSIELTEKGREELDALMVVVFDALLAVGPHDEEHMTEYVNAAHDLIARKRSHGDFR